MCSTQMDRFTFPTSSCVMDSHTWESSWWIVPHVLCWTNCRQFYLFRFPCCPLRQLQYNHLQKGFKKYWKDSQWEIQVGYEPGGWEAKVYKWWNPALFSAIPSTSPFPALWPSLLQNKFQMVQNDPFVFNKQAQEYPSWCDTVLAV